MFPVPHAPLLHLIFEGLGIIVAIILYDRLRAGGADEVPDTHRQYLLVAAAFGAFFGSRLLGGLEQPALFWTGGGPRGIVYYFSSKTIVGGLLGGLLAVELTKRLVGQTRRTGDVYVFPLVAATLLGRVGCFLMGVGEPTHGVPTDSWVGIDLGDGVPRHATALYEIALLLLLAMGLWWLPRRVTLRPGRLFMLYLTAYLLYRLIVGFWQPAVRFASLGVIQWACVAGLCWYLVEHYRLSRKPF